MQNYISILVILSIPYGSIGVLCAFIDCKKSSIDPHNKVTLLCKYHYGQMQKEIKDGGTHPFVYPNPDQNMIKTIQSPRKFNLDDKTQVMRILATAHKLGIFGLTTQEITDIGKLEPTAYTYRRRCSDLKNDRQLYVVGWRYNGRSLSEVLALGTAIPKEYFSNTVIDSHVSHHANHGFTRCGSCGSLDLGAKGTERILELIKNIRQEKHGNDVIELLNVLFPERGIPKTDSTRPNK